MTCLDCGGEHLEYAGPLSLTDSIIGNYQIENIECYKCNRCGKLLFPEAALEIIEAKENEILQKLINKQPWEDFLTTKQAAETLGISRQAIHKNRRIRRGFIYSTKLEENRFYLKKSVELFKKTGDGRFSLVEQKKASEVASFTLREKIITANIRYSEAANTLNPKHLYETQNSTNSLIGSKLWLTKYQPINQSRH